MVRLRTVRSLLAITVVVGALGAVGPQQTHGRFTDQHGGSAVFSASSPSTGGGGGGTSCASTSSNVVTADPGGPYSVQEASTKPLDGSGSSTSRGNIRSYCWRIESGPGSLTGEMTVGPDYTAPSGVAGETVTIRLVVTNNQGESDSDTTQFTIQSSN